METVTERPNKAEEIVPESVKEKALKPAAQAAQAYLKSKEESKERAPRSLGPARLYPAEFARTLYIAMAEMGTELSDLLDPGYWAHHAAKLKPWDRIELRAEDGTWFAELLVMDCDKTWAKVHLLAHDQLQDLGTAPAVRARQIASQKILTEHQVLFRGPRKWSIINLATKSIVKEDLPSREKAESWLWSFSSSTAPMSEV